MFKSLRSREAFHFKLLLFTQADVVVKNQKCLLIFHLKKGLKFQQRPLEWKKEKKGSLALMQLLEETTFFDTNCGSLYIYDEVDAVK